MDKERFRLKIQALSAMGEAVKAAQKVLEMERASGATGEKLDCVAEHVEKMEALYDECIQCCLDDIKQV